MKSKLSPYINFRGNTREVMEFYKSVFGGELSVSTFKEFGASEDPSEDNLVMHAQLQASNGITIMAADSPMRMVYTAGNNITLILDGDDVDELTAYFNALSAGGSITQPLATATWGDTFGMVDDKFGINWLVNISAKEE